MAFYDHSSTHLKMFFRDSSSDQSYRHPIEPYPPTSCIFLNRRRAVDDVTIPTMILLHVIHVALGDPVGRLRRGDKEPKTTSVIRHNLLQRYLRVMGVPSGVLLGLEKGIKVPEGRFQITVSRHLLEAHKEENIPTTDQCKK